MADSTQSTEEQPQTTRVELGSTSFDTDEFVHMLESLTRATESVEALQKDVADISTGLREEDAVRLIYGRSNGWSLSDIREMFNTLDAIEGSTDRKLIIRLLASLGGVTLDDAEEFTEEIDRLRSRYGDLATQ